ncbi:MAG: hypothetical protein COB03_03370 [Alteromonas sp.]|nr:MAG: hypothetical protein COB03_03370 [Alteromonas sp.]
MYLKLLSLLLRGIVVFITGLLIGSLADEAGVDVNVVFGLVILSWTIGSLWPITKFHECLGVLAMLRSRLSALKNQSNRNSEMRRLEDEMFRLKELRNSEIITEEEFNLKLTGIKKHYLEL